MLQRKPKRVVGYDMAFVILDVRHHFGTYNLNDGKEPDR